MNDRSYQFQTAIHCIYYPTRKWKESSNFPLMTFCQRHLETKREEDESWLIVASHGALNPNVFIHIQYSISLISIARLWMLVKAIGMWRLQRHDLPHQKLSPKGAVVDICTIKFVYQRTKDTSKLRRFMSCIFA